MSKETLKVDFESIKIVFNILLNSGSIETLKARELLGFKGKSKWANEQEQRRIFKAIELMYTIPLDEELAADELISSKRGSIVFISESYRLLMLNNKQVQQRDLMLRYLYFKSHEEDIEQSVTGMIKENLRDYFSAIESFKALEDNYIVKNINQAKNMNKNLKVIKVNDKEEHFLTPLKIYYDNGFWYFAALEDSEKLFWTKIISIDSIEILDELTKYNQKTLSHYKRLQFDAFGDENREQNYKIIIQLNDEYQYRYFQNKTFKKTQRLAPEEGRFCIEFQFIFIWEIQPLLLSWIDVMQIKKLEYIKKGVSSEEKEQKENDFFEEISFNMKKFIKNNLE